MLLGFAQSVELAARRPLPGRRSTPAPSDHGARRSCATTTRPTARSSPGSSASTRPATPDDAVVDERARRRSPTTDLPPLAAAPTTSSRRSSPRTPTSSASSRAPTAPHLIASIVMSRPATAPCSPTWRARQRLRRPVRQRGRAAARDRVERRLTMTTDQTSDRTTDRRRPTCVSRRRRLLRVGGITVALGALLAACGERRRGRAGPRRLRPAADGAARRGGQRRRVPAHGDVDRGHDRRDVRQSPTAAALEGGDQAMLDRSSTTTSDAVKATVRLTREAGGEPYECRQRLVRRPRRAADVRPHRRRPRARTSPPSDEPERDMLVVINGWSTMAAVDVPAMVELLDEPALRADVDGARRPRRRATRPPFALIIDRPPDGYVDPALARRRGRSPDDAGVAAGVRHPDRSARSPPSTIAVGAAERGRHPRSRRPRDARRQLATSTTAAEPDAATTLSGRRPTVRRCATCGDGESAGWPRHGSSRRGKSGLHRAGCWREPGRGDLTDSATERDRRWAGRPVTGKGETVR